MRASRLVLAATGLLAGLLGSAAAGEAQRPLSGVVELFTSQGCDSCPAADKVFAELAQRPDILALALHVDYWDYLGWRDTLAVPAHTVRQRRYAAAFGKRSVYTPQLVLNGRAQMNGARREEILRALKEMAKADAGLVVALDAETSDGGAAITLAAQPMPPKQPPARLLLVLFRAPVSLPIRGGENAGRTLVYWNPVTEVREIGRWDGGPARFELSWTGVADGSGAAAILQAYDGDGLPRAILGAVVLRQPKG